MTKVTDHASQATSTSGQVPVEVTGDGARARQIITVEDWTFTAFTGQGDQEPRVRDLDLAERLGFTRPAKIRDIIRRHAKAGNVAPLSVFTTVVRTDGKSYPVCEFWLAEADARFVASQSGTKLAIAETKKMIQGFILARRGLLPQQNVGAELVALLREELASMRVEMRQLRAEVHIGGVVGAEWAEENVRARLRRIADLETRVPGAKSRRSVNRTLANKLRNAVCFTRAGARWESYPRDPQLVSILTCTLNAMYDAAVGKITATVRADAEAKARAESEARLRQLGLFPDVSN